MKKMKLSVIVLLIGTLLMCPIYVSAETAGNLIEMEYPTVYLDDIDENMVPLTVNNYQISFKRESNTSGAGVVTVMTNSNASYIKVTITLQQAASGSSTYSNTTQEAITKTVYDTDYLKKSFSFKVTSSKNYRVKVVIKDKTKDVVSTKTIYKKMT